MIGKKLQLYNTAVSGSSWPKTPATAASKEDEILGI